jgi:hypothetical protein
MANGSRVHGLEEPEQEPQGRPAEDGASRRRPQAGRLTCRGGPERPQDDGTDAARACTISAMLCTMASAPLSENPSTLVGLLA